MKRSTARWTTAFAAAAWLAVPATGWSQSQPKPATTPPSSQQPATGAHAQHDSAQEHVRQAQAALNDIPAASIPAAAKAKFTQLKKHLSALEKAGTTAAPKSGSTTARSKSNWASEVAAIDKILTELLGPATTSATGEPTGATGTAGQTGTTKSKSATTLTLEEPVKTKLMAVRTHVTQFAAAMSGSGAAPDAAPASEPSTSAASQSSTASSPSAPTGAQSSTSSSAAAPAEQMQQQAAAQQPAAAQQQQPAEAAAQQVDTEASRRHLTAARDTLSQLTQLPAAAQLTGETRTQVSQLITNFNELISNNADWRASYEKVDANLTALIGPADASAAAPSPAPAPAPTGTPGAVGTTGAAAATLDPAIRAKLVEMRNHLTEFHKSAGGSAGEAANTPSSASSTTTPSATTPSPEPSAANQQSTPAAQAPAASTAAAQNPDSAIRHIEAIEAMLNGQGTISRTQIEQIRTHLAEIRKIVEKK